MDQVNESGEVKLLEDCDRYAIGEQRCDFVFIKDVADANLWCWQVIYNGGTAWRAALMI